MSQRQRLRRPKRVVCAGDLDTWITLQDRAIETPDFGDTNFGEVFSGGRTVAAKVVTVGQKTMFDRANVEQVLTHKITIYFDPKITAETWILLEGGTRLDIINTDNLDERGTFLDLYCTVRGSQDVEAARA